MTKQVKHSAVGAHTPGPWKVSKPSGAFGYEVVHNTGEKLYGVNLSGLICMMPHGPRKPEYEANALLIAAAPETAAERDRLKEINAELVEALEMAMRWVPKEGTTRDSCEAALAKCSGGAS